MKKLEIEATEHYVSILNPGDQVAEVIFEGELFSVLPGACICLIHPKMPDFPMMDELDEFESKEPDKKFKH